MTLFSTASRMASFLLVAGVTQLPAQVATSAAQATSPPSTGRQTQPSHGDVLFERHEAAPESTTAEPADAAAAPEQTSPAPRQGVSSSQRRARTTLRRRTAAGTPAEQPPTAAPAAAEPDPPGSAAFSSSSSAGEDVVQLPALSPQEIASAKGIAAGEHSAAHIVARDVELHLNTGTGQAEVRATVTVRNGSREPLRRVLLRVSGALHWESARMAGEAAVLPVEQHRVADDLDHTGLATEVVVPLREPLAAGAATQVDLYYSGSLLQSAQRLTALGAPAGRAALTDWDTVSSTFTGLRGLGNVLWYPVAGVGASLRDGDAVPAAVEASRLDEENSSFHLRLTAEYTGARPQAALFCGEEQLPVSAGAAESDGSGFVTAEWTRKSLGLRTPSLFLSTAAPQPEATGSVEVVTGDADAAVAVGKAAARIRPMLQEWLGVAPGRPLQVLDLPVPGAAAFADGALLVAPLETTSAAALPATLVQSLAAAWLPGSIAAPWLREGIPAFLQAVWVERTAGREAALAGLQGSMKTLAAQAASAEPPVSSSQAEAPVRAAGPPLAQCSAPACARVRAAYVFGMLRSLLGDAALQQALSGWAVQQVAQPGRSSADETRAMEDLLQQVAGKRDLHWFFENWVDEDRGLPELQIVTVAPRRVERSRSTDMITAPKKPVAGPIGAEPVAPTDPRDMGERDAAAYAAAHSNDAVPGSWLVAVEVQNNGSADAEVPVIVRAAGLSNTLPLRVPAHGRATVRIPFEAEPEEVQVNDGSVPESIPVQHRRALRRLSQ